MHRTYGYTQDAMHYLNRFDEIFETMQLAMTHVPLTDSISHNFILQMLPHHQAAIDIAKNILRFSAAEPIQCIAASVIREQTENMAALRQILTECGTYTNSDREICLYQWHYIRIINTMFSDMRNACADNDTDADFIREMMPHHQGAVSICQNTLKFRIHKELEPALHVIIRSYEKGSNHMEGLLYALL